MNEILNIFRFKLSFLIFRFSFLFFVLFFYVIIFFRFFIFSQYLLRFRRSAPGESLARRSLVIRRIYYIILYYILTTFFFARNVSFKLFCLQKYFLFISETLLFSFSSSLLISATIYRFSGVAIFYSFYNRRLLPFFFLKPFSPYLLPNVLS